MTQHRLKVQFQHGVVSALSSIRWIRRPSRSLSVDPSPPLTGGEGEQNSHRSGFHWTVRWKFYLSLERKGLFAETLLGEVIQRGNLSIEEYFILSEVYFLIKESTRSFHLKRLAISLEEILDLTIDFESRTRRIISLYWATGSDLFRIRGARKNTYLPYRKIVSIQTVPLEDHIDQKSSGVPYSSYCKGYGEGSSRGPEVTPFSAELDGDDTNRVLDPRIVKLVSYQINLATVEIRESFRRKKL